MDLLIVNGPNLNLLGVREPAIYGTRSFDDHLADLRATFSGHRIEAYQSNVEGELINALQEADGRYHGVVFNGAGFTHTSVALRDTIAALRIPVVEVHISNIHGREEFRERSLTAAKCVGVITGLGLDGYRLAIDHLLRRPVPGREP
jgi:3-dehydroquinate dehydratase II